MYTQDDVRAATAALGFGPIQTAALLAALADRYGTGWRELNWAAIRAVAEDDLGYEARVVATLQNKLALAAMGAGPVDKNRK